MYIQAKWPISLETISGFNSMKRIGVVLLPRMAIQGLKKSANQLFQTCRFSFWASNVSLTLVRWAGDPPSCLAMKWLKERTKTQVAQDKQYFKVTCPKGKLEFKNFLGPDSIAFNLQVPIYTPGWRETLWDSYGLPKNTTQCPQPGLGSGALDQESSALTTTRQIQRA